MKIIYLFLIISFSLSTSLNAEEYSYTERLKEDTRIVVGYLKSLKDEQIGKEIEGVKLTNNAYWLKSYTYLGKEVDENSFIHIFKFRFVDDGQTVEKNIIWIDSAGKPAKIKPPECPSGLPPWGNYFFQLQGDLYPYPIIQPGNLVYSICWVEN
jgi:hypothetical protein